MAVKFEIEISWKSGIGKNAQYYVFAKCLEMEQDFVLTDHSRLGGIEISNYLSQPRALDQSGKPRRDILTFKIRHKIDGEKLQAGQIVELTHGHETS